jgi:AraC-like DNA-binding protein
MERSSDSRRSREERREQVRKYVTRHLRDPQLTVGGIAAQFEYSRRTLARLFADEGETLSQSINRQRLEGAREEIMNPLLWDRLLVEIALSWGFSDYAYFSRGFRARFGLTPIMARRGAMNSRVQQTSARDQPDVAPD